MNYFFLNHHKLDKKISNYIADKVGTLDNVIQSFIVINKNFHYNDNEAVFFRDKLYMHESSFREFLKFDSILQEYLSINILNIICFKSFKNHKFKLKQKINSQDYDILKIAKFIETNQKKINGKGFNFNEILKIYESIDYEVLNNIKNYRDQHYSHIDTSRSFEDNTITFELLDISNKLTQMFEIIYKYITKESIFEKNLIDFSEIKIKTLKYDLILRYIHRGLEINNDIIEKMENIESIKDIYLFLESTSSSSKQ